MAREHVEKTEGIEALAAEVVRFAKQLEEATERKELTSRDASAARNEELAAGTALKEAAAKLIKAQEELVKRANV